MRKLAILSLVLFGVAFWSCDDDIEDRPVLSMEEVPVFDAPFGSSYALSPEDPTALVETFTWDEARYSESVVPQYTLEIALSGTDFTPYEVLGTTTDNKLSVTSEALNNAILALEGIPFSENIMELRLRVELGTMTAEFAEEIHSLVITPYTTDLPRIVVPGDHQGWDPPSAPQLAASAFGASDYEGFVWLNNEFKFVGVNENGEFQWGNIDWGDDGAGNLTAEGENNIMPPAGPGYYYVQVDTEAMTYSINPVSYGIIGEATPGGWGSDTDLTYDAGTQTLYADMDLVPGEFKFRANDAWHGGTFPYEVGPPNADGFLDGGGGNIMFDGGAGNYRVTLDFSNPRAYTYSITPN